MDINRVCHSVFCGQSERHFRGQTIFYMTRPGSALWKPCKSRTFSRLIVHARPPFPFTFRFLPPMNVGGAVRAVFCPVGFWNEHAAADLTAFQVLSSENLRFQRPGKRQDRPAEPLTADRERNHLRTGAGVPIVKDNAVAVLTVTALPPDKGVGLFSLRWRHAVGRAVWLVLQRRQAFIWVISHVFPPFFRCRFPRKGFRPISAAWFLL